MQNELLYYSKTEVYSLSGLQSIEKQPRSEGTPGQQVVIMDVCLRNAQASNDGPVVGGCPALEDSTHSQWM